MAVGHGCTGKGNDQVRFDVSISALAPDLKIIAPVREWRMTRDDEIEYASAHGIPVPVTLKSPYSVDQNLWGRSIECGVLEDPWQEPPAEVYSWTKDPATAPAEPLYLEIDFEKGIPVAINGEAMDGVALIQKLNTLAGEHGVGRVDHIENRLVGIKSREIYEAPAAIVLHAAHNDLEAMTMTRTPPASRPRWPRSTRTSSTMASGSRPFIRTWPPTWPAASAMSPARSVCGCTAVYALRWAASRRCRYTIWNWPPMTRPMPLITTPLLASSSCGVCR